MAERPEKFPAWAREDQTDPVSGQVNRSEPPEARKDSGWNRQEIPPRQWLNWLTFKANEWIEWLTGRVDVLRTDVDTAQSTADDHIAEGVADSPHGIGSVSAFAGDQDLRTTDSVTFSRTQAGDFDSDQTGSAYNKEADQNLRTTDTVQFGRVTDAATPGDGDFDSSQFGYYEAVVELGLRFDAGQEVFFTRVGRLVTMTTKGVLTHEEGAFPQSDAGAAPSWAIPPSSVRNAYSGTGNDTRIVSVADDGQISFQYASERTDTAAICAISYHVDIP